MPHRILPTPMCTCEDAGMAVEPAHFTPTGSGDFAAAPFAQSHWGDDDLNGPAFAGLSARAPEFGSESPDSCRGG